MLSVFNEKDEFYDLSVDPKEMENRIDDKAYAKIIDEMQKVMLEFFVRTADSVPMKKRSEVVYESGYNVRMPERWI